jgi:hypothetical protein
VVNTRYLLAAQVIDDWYEFRARVRSQSNGELTASEISPRYTRLLDTKSAIPAVTVVLKIHIKQCQYPC